MPELTPQEFLDKYLKPAKESDHICWNCIHLKPVIEGSEFPPADIIGWCKKIHFPHYWCVADFNVVRKCYAFEAKHKDKDKGISKTAPVESSNLKDDIKISKYESPIEDKITDHKSPSFHFKLEGEQTIGDTVQCNSDVDLVFDYGLIEGNVLAKIHGEKLPKHDAELGIAVAPKGFTFRDNNWYLIAVFREGKIQEPVRFRFKAADKPIVDAGFYITFYLKGYILYQFPVALNLVEQIDALDVHKPWIPLDLDLDDIISEEEYSTSFIGRT